ncbi:hypothetical protein GUJ93_ZPchr0008g13497 [Zizania palustris]|uniref:Uncharacterized protein n=1 Tax=Zizania palustris TaxID=103762 RepID=A0A8J5REW1_ZIZPA|nr:hypothetical protein GUJ93_ZPchr0008g13497 [Zizania palustris]
MKDDFIIRHVVKLNLFKPIIDAFVENGDRYNMLQKAEERGLEKEEEDYFNEDSDEEDSGCRTKYSQNQDSSAKLANGSEAGGVSSRSKSGGLVDYADHDDDDFNPPPKEPDRPTEDDEPFKDICREAKHSEYSGLQTIGWGDSQETKDRNKNY